DPRPRRPAQRATHAQRALLHGLAYQRAHLVEFPGCDRPGALTMYISPDLARADIASDVGRNSLPQQTCEVAVEVRPVGGRAVRSHMMLTSLLLAADGRGRLALAQNHRRHALPDHALGVSVHQQRVIRVVMDVDEPRRDRQALRVNNPLCRFAGKMAERRDAVLPNADIAVKCGIPSAVYNQ